jgi:hypothetical protein
MRRRARGGVVGRVRVKDARVLVYREVMRTGVGTRTYIQGEGECK